MTPQPRPPSLDSIKKSLVALRMPRALEMLDATFRRIEQGEIDGTGSKPSTSSSSRNSACARAGASAPP